MNSFSLRQGYNNEVGSIEPFVLHEVRDEGDGLDGFTQTHLVRQDAVQVVVVEGNQPLQTFNLNDKRGGNLSDVKKYFLQLITLVIIMKYHVLHLVELVYLILLELSIYQQSRLFVHLLCDSVGNRIIRLEPTGKCCAAIFIIHILFGISAEESVSVSRDIK